MKRWIIYIGMLTILGIPSSVLNMDGHAYQPDKKETSGNPKVTEMTMHGSTQLAYAANDMNSAETVAVRTDGSSKEDQPDKQAILREVLKYSDHQRDDDPMIEWKEGIKVKKSNVQGVEYKGETYYYSLVPHMSFDPVARGEWDRDEVEVIYQSRDSRPLLIYKK